MVSNIERLASRRQIEALIRADPTEVQFQRRTKVDTPSGGWKWIDPPVVLQPQTVAMVPFKRRMTEFMVDTQFGEVPDLPYVIVGKHDLDVKRGDVFTVGDQVFQVQTIDIKRDIRVAAQVDYYGGDDASGS